MTWLGEDGPWPRAVHVTAQPPASFTDKARVSTTDTDVNASNDTRSVKTRVGKKHGAKVIVIVN